ncbi:FAD-dependent oxidoreductase [soil metagenome]
MASDAAGADLRAVVPHTAAGAEASGAGENVPRAAEGIRRRELLTGAASLPLAAAMAACSRDEAARYSGGWVGAQVDRGHKLRDSKAGTWPAPSVQRRAGAIVVGAGISGLAAARAFAKAGVDDVQVFDLEDAPGGNSRGHAMGGMGCPLGAHYLPIPGERAVEVIELLEELGLRRTEGGQPVYDERHLCHSPQERIFIAGHWHDGLLPPVEALPADQRETTLAQYRRFGALVAKVGDGGAFAIPTARATWSPELTALDAITFARWLDAQSLTAPALRWYLDYCCRDDYGAGAPQVSAWAGLHYFASRHGFHAPGDGSDEREGVFTWPEGNAWLGRKLAAPLGDRLHTGRMALRVTEGRQTASVDVWNAIDSRVERWTSPRLVLAVPLFIAARLLDAPPPALLEAAAAMRHAPWLVANVQIGEPLTDHPGAAPSWDNVVYDPLVVASANPLVVASPDPLVGSSANPTLSPALGYVDAMHQSTRPYAGPTVLTAYWALGGDNPEQLKSQRARLLNEPWSAWAQAVVGNLLPAHPDLPGKITRIDLMRYGHAMSIPVPGVRSSAALQALADARGPVRFAHSDLASYSIFEEAMYFGARAARA